MNFALYSTILFVVLSSTGESKAEPVTIINPGFEALVLSDNSSDRELSGWIKSGAGGTWNPPSTEYPLGVPEGQNIAFSNDPEISQFLFDVLTPNKTYVLQVEVGNRLTQPFPGYAVQLLTADGVVLAEDNNSLTIEDGTFATSTVQFTALPGNVHLGKRLQIRLRSFGPQISFDDVRLDVADFPSPPGSLCDVNQDGLVTPADALCCFQEFLGLQSCLN